MIWLVTFIATPIFAEAKIELKDISKCSKDGDCIVVIHSDCSHKKYMAINKEFKQLCEQTIEWQSSNIACAMKGKPLSGLGPSYPYCRN
jgi:hypothetical protein